MAQHCKCGHPVERHVNSGTSGCIALIKKDDLQDEFCTCPRTRREAFETYLQRVRDRVATAGGN